MVLYFPLSYFEVATLFYRVHVILKTYIKLGCWNSEGILMLNKVATMSLVLKKGFVQHNFIYIYQIKDLEFTLVLESLQVIPRPFLA